MPPSRPIEERFWEKVDKRGPDDCWTWKASQVGDTGYGQFRQGKTMRRAHRVAYELCHGTRLGQEKVLHTCDNPICVNPAHLLLGTCADNSSDMVSKGRHSYGENRPLSKLTDADVEEIREVYTPRCPINGRLGLSRRYKVSPKTIQRAVKRVCWKHVP